MTFLMNYEGYRIYNTQLYFFIKTLSAIDAVPMETVIDHQKNLNLDNCVTFHAQIRLNVSSTSGSHISNILTEH